LIISDCREKQAKISRQISKKYEKSLRIGDLYGNQRRKNKSVSSVNKYVTSDTVTELNSLPASDLGKNQRWKK
jgi:hypothetical protein